MWGVFCCEGSNFVGRGWFFPRGGLVFGDGFHSGAVYFVRVVFISVCFSL